MSYSGAKEMRRMVWDPIIFMMLFQSSNTFVSANISFDINHNSKAIDANTTSNCVKPDLVNYVMDVMLFRGEEKDVDSKLNIAIAENAAEI